MTLEIFIYTFLCAFGFILLYELKPYKKALKFHSYRPNFSPSLTTSFGLKVRSKSEIIIAEKLYEKKIPFSYELPLTCKNKTYYPDFTIKIGSKVFYWEHFGLLHDKKYFKHTQVKMRWYDENFPNKLIWTEEHPELSVHVHNITEKLRKFGS